MSRREFCRITLCLTGIFLTLVCARSDAASLSPTLLVANQESLNRFCPTAFPDLQAEYASAYSRWIENNRDRIDRVRARPDYDQTLEQAEQSLRQEADSTTRRTKCVTGLRVLNNSNWQALLDLSLGDPPRQAKASSDPRTAFIQSCVNRGLQKAQTTTYLNSLCPCMWGVISRNWSLQDLTDLVALEKEGGQSLVNSPQFARVRPQLEQCVVRAAGGATTPISRATASDSCGMRFGSLQSAGSHSRGRVEGFVTRQEAMALINATQRQLNGTISPGYIENQRVKVGPVTSGPGQPHRTVTVVVPVGMTVNIGDVVDFVTARPDPALSCHYIPNVIDHAAVLDR